LSPMVSYLEFAIGTSYMCTSYAFHALFTTKLQAKPSASLPYSIEFARWSNSHCQDDAELCLAAHHPRVSLGRFLERIGFNHGAHAG